MPVGFIDPNQVERFRAAINDDPEFKLASKFLKADILLEVGDSRCIVRIHEGTVTEFKLDPVLQDTSYGMYIKAPVEDWERLLEPVPSLFYDDFITAAIHHNFEYGGNTEISFGYQSALICMVKVMRKVQTGQTGPVVSPKELPPAGTIEPIVGKYVHIELEGDQYRIYFEECGEGIPLLCQHTAGCDGRQYRHIMNDREITSKYRVIAMDLPYHGRSLPPQSVEWWKGEYRLTRALALDLPVAFSHTLGLDKPVYMGCSVGGMIAADLALEHPDEFRAIIAVEVAEYAPGYSHRWWINPRTSDAKSSMMSMQSPFSPEVYRRENCWISGQGFTGVLKGDTHYYSELHNLTDKSHLIDTSRIDLYILNGEWDPVTPPIAGKMLADKIRGAEFIEMKQLGHFPVSENPEVFKTYLKPVLNEIAAKG